MARFSYLGVDDRGVESRGVIEAPSLAAAVGEIRARGVAPLKVEPDAPEVSPGPLEEMDAYSYFNRSLAELCRVGMPLPRAIGEVSRALRRGRFRDQVVRVEKDLREGKSLSEAVAREGFPGYYRSMVRAGVSSGNLPAVLHSVARTHEGSLKAQRAVVSALCYPAVSFLLGTILVGIFLIFCLPGIREFYRFHEIVPSFQVDLLFRAADNPVVPVAMLLGLLAGLGGLVLWLRRTAAGETVLLRLPGIGPLIRSLVTARCLGALSALLKAKVPLQEALEVALGAGGSRVLSRDCKRMCARASEGEKLADILGGSPALSPGVGSYLQLGEEGGRLAEAAGETGEIQMERSAAGAATLFVILFPLAMIGIGVIMGSLIFTFASGYLDVLRQVGR